MTSGFAFHSEVNKTEQKQTEAHEVDYSLNLQELPEDRLLRSILLDKATTGAIRSLLIWGMINLGVWYMFYEDTMSTLSKIKTPPGTFDTFIYGGAVIGICMLVFGMLGAVTRSSIVGWLDGISLLVVGVWNICHDFGLADAVRPYGYTMKQPSTIWIMLGIGQLVWGGEAEFSIHELGRQAERHCSSGEGRGTR